MSFERLITPLARITTLVTTESVRDALGEMAAHHLAAAPVVDGEGHYAGTITTDDLRRHVAGHRERRALKAPLCEVPQHAQNPALSVDHLGALAARACGHGFVPVVDGEGKLLGIIDRRRLPDLRFPRAA